MVKIGTKVVKLGGETFFVGYWYALPARSKSAVLLTSPNNKLKETETQKLIVETFGHLAPKEKSIYRRTNLVKVAELRPNVGSCKSRYNCWGA